MPIRKCSGSPDRWRIGMGDCMYTSYDNAVRAYQAYLASHPEEVDNPIAFDYDDTLTLPKYQALAKRFVSQQKVVYIITERPKAWDDPVFALADELGIPRSHVIFTEDKIEEAKRLRIHTFYDNNADTVNRLNKETLTLGIKV